MFKLTPLLPHRNHIMPQNPLQGHDSHFTPQAKRLKVEKTQTFVL